MDAIDALLTRRSVRNYTDEDVSEAQVQSMLRAAMSAPTAHNTQAWRFVVVRDAAVRQRLSVASKWAGMIAHAPVAIVVCADITAEKTPDSYWPQECGAATEAILTAAHAMGLGAVWVGVHPFEDRITAVSDAIGLPGHIRPQCQIAIGHSAEVKEAVDRFDPDKIRYDRW